MNRIIGIIFLSLVVSINANAQDSADESKIKFSCFKDTAKDSVYFREIQISARMINQAICNAILIPTRKSITDGFPRDEVAAFGGLVKKDASAKFGSVHLNKLEEQLNYFETTLSSGELYPEAMPTFNVQKGTDPREPNYYYFFTGDQKEQGVLTPEEDQKCQADIKLKAPCLTVLEQLDEAVFPYQRNANAFTAYDTRAKLNTLSQQWDSYFESARAQTFADIAVTTLFERNHFKRDYLVGPPDRQWFVLHPNLVLENVEAASDGENTNVALSIEWVGINWWENAIIGIPFGASLTSLYSDRPGVNDIALFGVTLYFDNKYAIGYARHGGDDGFFVSMDLLKAFEDKTKQVGRYKDRIRNILN